jgi:hypothetical protein
VGLRAARKGPQRLRLNNAAPALERRPWPGGKRLRSQEKNRTSSLLLERFGPFLAAENLNEEMVPHRCEDLAPMHAASRVMKSPVRRRRDGVRAKEHFGEPVQMEVPSTPGRAVGPARLHLWIAQACRCDVARPEPQPENFGEVDTGNFT